MGWTAILLAGSRPGVDPFAAANGTDLKALVPVSGRPMVARPVEALLNSGGIDGVRVLAQQSDRLAPVLPDDGRLSVEPSGSTIAATLEALCLDPATQWPVLVTTADHALLDAAMVEEFCRRSAGADIAIGLVERRALLARLPQSKRTWLRFRGGAYSGANLFALAGPQVLPALRLWRSVEQDRKKVFKLLWGIGPLTFLGAALRLRTLEGTMKRLSRRLGLSIRAIEMTDPLAAVDVDKQSDLELVEAIIGGRA